MQILKELIKREIAGDTILVPVGKSVYDSHGLYMMNELAAFLWERLPEATDEAELLAAVLEEYEVDAETAQADIAAFMADLRKLGIIE